MLIMTASIVEPYYRCFIVTLTDSFKGNPMDPLKEPPLGGLSVVIKRVVSHLIRVITIVILLITPFLTTHEPPKVGKIMAQNL